jgi:hypothetical protein
MYTASISQKFPGLFLILLDQSSSMQDSFGRCTRAEAAAEAINTVIHEIQLSCEKGDKIVDRCSVGVIVYGAKVAPIMACPISEVENQIVEYRRCKKGDLRCAGGVYPVDYSLPIWVRPVAAGSTPMHRAFEQATAIVTRWSELHPSSFPAVVINITDGEPDKVDLTLVAAQQLKSTGTNDGKTLLFNVHIGDGHSTGELMLPSTLPENSSHYARLLFDLSSVLPGSMVEAAVRLGFAAKPNSRGYVYNASESSLVRFIEFGSSSMKLR